MQAPRVDEVIDSVLGQFNDALAKRLGGEAIFLCCPMMPPWDDALRVAIEKIASNGGAQKKLIVVLETSGGYIESVERMVRVMRTHYEEVDFIVPNYAYSAGTILALSGDDILMDYHSVLGPIDPQFPMPGGDFVPGMGYLAKYKELMKVINSADDASKVRAEISFLVEKFDPAKLFNIEQAIEHSKTLLKDWLPRYKFKNWTHRESSGDAVTGADKQKRANDIAEALGNAEKWHSHGRGITCDDLTSENIKLKINNYGSNTDLKRDIRNYHGMLGDYMGKRSWTSAVHTRLGFGGMS
ncbi:hypothetical protein GCM10011521_17800 [Arenimonas soli]|uniref:Serine dehydrogenasease n=1 Tax=Arenimonas soli TaxID=2269504 RepID=A0ABQ1HJ66_9GAMM|nr:serine dehydrogenasease [Arenimonas soli]GGA79997.1 hypothetical protein GCM10011521_17800 [Arenimonas soli]